MQRHLQLEWAWTHGLVLAMMGVGSVLNSGGLVLAMMGVGSVLNSGGPVPTLDSRSLK